MNTRGEQLEQHDILKAKLMGELDDDDKDVFAKIWEACSDMTGYVQMHFISHNNIIRENLFGREWDKMPPCKWEEYKKCINEFIEKSKQNDKKKDRQETTSKETSQVIKDIINTDFDDVSYDGYIDDDVHVRFESIIEFPYFLLHTLKVLISIKGIRHRDNSLRIEDKLLDDKRLLESFKRVIECGVTDYGSIDKAQFTKDFIICLLRTRYLFDKYILKREFINENSDGAWSLKSLKVSNQGNNKKPYYCNSQFQECDNAGEGLTQNNIMIQSALRVSYTSPKVMRWITQLLIWLSEEDYKHSERTQDDMKYYSKIIESIAKEAVLEDFLHNKECKDEIFALGVNTPHIVFNYLDYLLWKNNPTKYKDFVFEFRNSVEHWYPQNPSDGKWNDVDRFGNLCIIQRNVNSKFSNLPPDAKKVAFEKMISKGSIKLRLMSDLTKSQGDKKAIDYWKETAFRQHENEMIDLLKNACEE